LLEVLFWFVIVLGEIDLKSFDIYSKF